jgi:hypothetical protein
MVRALQPASPASRARIAFPARVHCQNVNRKKRGPRVRYLRGYNSPTRTIKPPRLNIGSDELRSTSSALSTVSPILSGDMSTRTLAPRSLLFRSTSVLRRAKSFHSDDASAAFHFCGGSRLGPSGFSGSMEASASASRTATDVHPADRSSLKIAWQVAGFRARFVVIRPDQHVTFVERIPRNLTNGLRTAVPSDRNMIRE